MSRQYQTEESQSEESGKYNLQVIICYCNTKEKYEGVELFTEKTITLSLY